MKKLIVAALAAVGLSGCIAVPAPYAGDPYYYPAAPVVVAPPVVGIGLGFHGGHRHHHRHHRHHRHW